MNVNNKNEECEEIQARVTKGNKVQEDSYTS